MPRLRANRYLTCFYCNRRSNTRYDGVTREFLCLHCDATNYLDENGEITDPPVATEREAPATHYANPRASPSPAPQDDIFCRTCLKNQRLFTTSLAQYYPDDPSDPEYPALERNYYRFRKNLEARYPQVCPECAERVERRIRQAGYTAKTDHLRRMVEKSRGRRTEAGQTTWLDWLDNIGRMLWNAGFALQLFWHVKLVAGVLERRDEGMYDPDDRSWAKLAISCLSWAAAFLPPAGHLISAAIVSSVLSAWWNPKFVQVTRGFTRHLLGFTQWYAFQGLIVFFRYLFPRALEVEQGRAQSRAAQLSAHLVMAVGMFLMHSFAARSIRVDTTPLFGSHTPLSPQPTITQSARPEELKTFSDQLNEALGETEPSPSMNRPRTVNAFSNQYPPEDSPSARTASLDFNRPATRVQDDDEMDWQPTVTQVPRRPFGEASQNWPKQRFGETPVNHESPFWYKVPAAPTNPAQRLRNPPQPVLRKKPVEKEAVFFPQSKGIPKQTPKEDTGVEFQQPRFFAKKPQTSNTDINLANLLNSSFSLEQEDVEPEPRRERSLPPRNVSRSRREFSSQPLRAEKPLGVEFVIIACFLGLWLVTVSLPIAFGREVQLAILSGAGLIALRITGDAAKDTKYEQVPSTAACVGSVLSVLELAAVCWLGWEVWKGETDTGKYGIGVLAAMLAHQFWNTTI